MANSLEQLVGEWYEDQEFLVRRNVLVGKRTTGGYEGELDVVAFHPVERKLVHIETSTDADSWEKRRARFKKKFEVGDKYIRDVFRGVGEPRSVERIALIAFGAARRNPMIGDAKVLTLSDFMQTIRKELAERSYYSKIDREQFVILRGLHFAAHFWK